MESARPWWKRGDAWVGLLLFGVGVGYVAVWPRDFYWQADEGQYLYEAKRVSAA